MYFYVEDNLNPRVVGTSFLIWLELVKEYLDIGSGIGQVLLGLYYLIVFCPIIFFIYPLYCHLHLSINPILFLNNKKQHNYYSLW